MEIRQTVDSNSARVIFDNIRESLEKSHLHQFVAIEPQSVNYYLGATLSEAIGSARQEFPDRLAHAFRLGHRTAVHFGMQIQ